jgi:methylglutamate dehydrogenase subunit B
VTQIVCPFCGARELREFEFRKTLPAANASAFARVYLRVDRGNASLEHWQHVHGCRAWLLIERNPHDDSVLGVRSLEAQP